MKTFKFTGRKFDTEKKYYTWDTEKKYYTYDIVESKEIGIFKFKNLHDAELFLISNFPEYYFGANIIQIDDANPDFICFATVDYYESCYKTDNRNYILEKELERILKETGD